MISEYSIGDENVSVSTYFEYLRRDRYSTPAVLRKQGIYLDYPYERTSRSMLNPRINARGSNGTTINSIFVANLGPNSYLDTSVRQLPPDVDIINKLADKWKQTDFNVGMYLSPEGRESIEMMLSSMMRLSNSAREFKRGNLGSALRNLDHLPRSARRTVARKFNSGDVSGAFLSAHLGWEPLIKDIYEASHIKSLEEEPLRLFASRKGTPAKWRVINPGPCKIESSETLKVKILMDVARPPTFTERFGLGNAFSIAWELVPLSFVADYFLPIGSVIDSMYFISQVRVKQAWKKTFEDAVVKYTLPRGYAWTEPNWVTYVVQNDATVYRHYRSYTRKPYTLDFASPLSGLSVKLPTSVMKLGTMSALLHQRLRAL